MKDYKINTGRGPLDDDDIERGKNFDEVLKKYQAINTPLFKTPKFWGSASAVLVAGITAIIVYSKLTSVVAPTSFINPPIAAADIKFTTYEINAATGSTITHASGSKIHVPGNAFLNKEGKAVTGTVQLQYREFQKTSEVFLSGIPMTYDSAGQQYHFETAGMMEIGASQNGEALQANPSANITVDMVSNNGEDRFNTYYLDTAEKKWRYIAQTNYNAPIAQPDTMVGDKPMEKSPELQNLQTEIANMEKQKPVEPKKVDNKKPFFTIKVDEKEFPEIAVYNNLKFQADDKTYNPDKADINWSNVELKKVEGSKNYKITFSNSRESYTVNAMPVFAEKDYAGAMNIYESKYAEYQSKLAKRKADEAKLLADAEAKSKEVEKQLADVAKRRAEYEAQLGQSDLVYRTFVVNNFGIWNCDYPNSLPQGENVLALMRNAKTGKPVEIMYCYLVEKGRNAMFSYSTSGLGNFRFNPQKENLVWAFTRDLKVAVIKPDAFKAARRHGREMQLDLTIIDKKFTSTADVQQYLDI